MADYELVAEQLDNLVADLMAVSMGHALTAAEQVQIAGRALTLINHLVAVIEQVREEVNKDLFNYPRAWPLNRILSTAPATVLAQRDARVLRDAADDIAARANVPRLIELADRHAGFYAGSRSAMQNEESKLRERAARIEREAGL